MHRFLTPLLFAALSLPVAARAQDHDDQRDRRQDAARYEDRTHRDSHEWNEKEERAYKRYLEEHHKKYKDFSREKEKQQQEYWNWRHSHPDADDDRR